MSLLVSNNGSLQVAVLGPPVQYGSPICSGTGDITNVKRVQLEHQDHLVVLRVSGAVQLHKFYPAHNQYQIIKEWRNGVMHANDKIVDMGIIRQTYLYTCSGEGVFVIRDLVNDDDDHRCKECKLSGPVTSIKVSEAKENFRVAVGSKDMGVRLYQISFDKDYLVDDTIASKMYNLHQNSNVVSMNRVRYLLRRRSESASKEKLVPQWQTPAFFETYWVVSLEFWRHYVICGTQFGFIVVYDSTTVSDTPIKVIKNSGSPIINLKDVGNHLVACDMMSKINVIRLPTFEEVNSYTYNFGIIEQSKILVHRRTARDVVVVAATAAGRLVALRLRPDDSYEVVHDMAMPQPVQAFLVLRWHRSG
ncbi:hypothetical protein PSN45_001141 [Yamadazyma tenuis]|uniref:Ribosome biogenesis protein NSA1 n=1 Tax=Candida tenuis (strain ATCC 10573 / BCRC 21748 / CBS 615 / JCM 9827 / NBRC 10315 / NRRL Y-1498 / VKM Y-70) TaxID=590646 RepID=G3B8P1_CANTC|nr:uncharacterized protein CANTEDRAFT_136328 [Yamadazyma tenuis ATCC 10573]EGV62402.1 hypothetical protein CANTEDRAFT_136328 [Yamadazyma tenuis ATCC 10573]WEJ93669.1 hypothetical protein PSN45_001141 [Yamadazyma tenuis]